MATLAIIRQDPWAGIITPPQPQSDHFYNLALRGDSSSSISTYLSLFENEESQGA